jgi:hypothetical protein
LNINGTEVCRWFGVATIEQGCVDAWFAFAYQAEMCILNMDVSGNSPVDEKVVLTMTMHL